MNTPILNREFQHPSDGWYHIEPKGDHPAVSDEGQNLLEIIDDQAVESIVTAFNRQAEEYPAKYGTEWPGMLIDREHFSHDPEKETAADGWLMAVQNRAGQLHGQINWSDTGKQAVDGKRYRFFSTEYEPGCLEILNRDANGRLHVRPRALSGLSLTNRPNNKGAHPITNRKVSPEEPASHPAGKSQKADTQHKRTMSKIAEKLGLSAEASEDSMLDEIEKLIQKAKVANKAEEEKEGLKNRVKELETEQIDADLETAGIKDEATVTQIKPYLGTLKNREARTGFLKTLAAGKKEPEPKKEPLTVRNRAKTPGAAAAAEEGAATQEDAARAVRIRNRASELRSNSKGTISLPAAYSQATVQIDAEITAGK